MAEEKTEKKQAGVNPKTILKIIVGAILIIIGIALVIYWWRPLFILIKGCIGLFLIMAGAITIAIAKE